MGYQLGDVKPWVRAAADYFGHAFGISTIGGWRAHGSVPGSDHPKGLALDFMTRSKATGDALAASLVKNAKAWNVKYVIWWREIWTPDRGWHPYTGPVPHTDHVHASFTSSGKVPDASTPPAGGKLPGAGSLLDPLGVAGAISKLADKVGDVGASAAQVGRAAELVTTAFLPTSLVRASAGFGGLLCVLLGVWFLSREVRNA